MIFFVMKGFRAHQAVENRGKTAASGHKKSPQQRALAISGD
ncbi:hypothetical protein HMPREF9080_00462 [Cardiobacterium valvarum F0432]|uniref:Uncharacterized protein n=1 Tax=Cardiobacterium valvarum F0432 TaxID=797473 RepID=G9ZCI5_9GAMM|nr:hypothetical protein HMPREF9080_00462 [Cardiobacterium valvarum F0432]